MRAALGRVAAIVCALILAVLWSSCASWGSFEDNTPIRVGLSADLWKAYEARVALGVIRHAALDLNAVTVCDPGPKVFCHPFVGDGAVKLVISDVADALADLDELPARYKTATALATVHLARNLPIEDLGKLSPYLDAARRITGADRILP